MNEKELLEKMLYYRKMFFNASQENIELKNLLLKTARKLFDCAKNPLDDKEIIDIMEEIEKRLTD